MSRLYAKSKGKYGQPTLEEHTFDVCRVAETLFGLPGIPTHLGIAWLRFFRIELSEHLEFVRTLVAAAAFHDLGKATETFQQAVTARTVQSIRHEHLSALVIAIPKVWEWLTRHQNIDWQVVIASVDCHHLKTPRGLRLAALDGCSLHVRLLTNHSDFKALQRFIKDRLHLTGEWPPLPEYWNFAPAIKDARMRVEDAIYDLDVNPQETPKQTALLRAVRAALIVADGAASGLVRESKDLDAWLQAAFVDDGPLDGHYVEETIIERRLKQVRAKNSGIFRWSKFQDECAKLPPRALLLAPCGSGKTLAAWRWIKSQLTQRPARRVIFLYPTRATATEGFRDYVSWAPEAVAGLMHGTARYELDGMFANPPDDDPRKEKRFEAEDARLFAVGFWTKRVFSATVDQFLAFMQHGYASTCMLPVLADSVVVIDEVHSFDHGMFSALKDFVKAFDVPVLCMTATLPADRRNELVAECGLKPYDEKPDELLKIAGAKRYCVCSVTEAEAERRVCEDLKKGRRVLWVVNQVARAQSLARKFLSDPPRSDLRTLCYHRASRSTIESIGTKGSSRRFRTNPIRPSWH